MAIVEERRLSEEVSVVKASWVVADALQRSSMLPGQLPPPD